LLILISIPFINGCAPKPIEIKTTEEPRPKLALPPVHSLGMDVFHWSVIDQDDKTYMCLTPEGYKTLALDNKRVYYFMRQQTDQLNAYKQYYEPASEQ